MIFHLAHSCRGRCLPLSRVHTGSGQMTFSKWCAQHSPTPTAGKRNSQATSFDLSYDSQSPESNRIDSGFREPYSTATWVRMV